MRTTVIALVLILIASAAGAVVVNFPDPGLEAAVRSEIGIPSAPINDYDLVGTGFTQLFAPFAGISDLSGLEYCTDLSALYLYSNEISDISALVGLTNLIDVWLDYNQISDISPLAGLTNLEWLYLQFNQISDVGALVANAGVGSGDTVWLQSNPLSRQALCTDIPAIEARGASVTNDGTCSSLGTVYVDFAAGSPTGTGEQIDPIDSLSAALTIVGVAGAIRINAGSTTETMTIDQDVTIEAVSGMVRIGVGARSSDNGRRWGFVSRGWAHTN